MTLRPFDYIIEDTFVNYDTRSLLCGKTFTAYHKRILLEIIRYYASKAFKGNTETERNIINYVQYVFDTKPTVTYDELMSLFHAKSNECLLAYILVAYNDENISIILHCMYTFCRVLPFRSATEWYDNYRLNNYGHPLNMIMWNDYDCDDTYTIDRKFPNDINKSVQLDFKRILKRLVGPLRAFIIDHSLYPTSANISTKGVTINMPTNTPTPTVNTPTVNIPTTINSNGEYTGNADEFANDRATFRANIPMVMPGMNPLNQHRTSTSRNSTSKTSKRQHPTSKPKQLTNADYYGCVGRKYTRQRAKLNKGIKGGDIEAYTTDAAVTEFRTGKHDPSSRNLTAEEICDECYQHYPYFFVGAHGCDVFDTYLSPTIEDLTHFFERYPSARVGYILNTATYASGNGEHWVALELSKGKAKLICSQAGDFGGFNDNGRLFKLLQQFLYGTSHNIVRFQVDSYSCGIFSALSLYKLLMTGSIELTVDQIGMNGSALKDGMDINDIRARMAGTTH